MLAMYSTQGEKVRLFQKVATKLSPQWLGVVVKLEAHNPHAIIRVVPFPEKVAEKRASTWLESLIASVPLEKRDYKKYTHR